MYVTGLKDSLLQHSPGKQLAVLAQRRQGQKQLEAGLSKSAQRARKKNRGAEIWGGGEEGSWEMLPFFFLTFSDPRQVLEDTRQMLQSFLIDSRNKTSNKKTSSSILYSQ